MGLSESLIKRIAVIVLLTFVGMRLADAHLHLCVDGADAPITVHAVDRSGDDSHLHEADHSQDRDIQLFDAVLLKKAGIDSDLFVVAGTFVFSVIVPPQLNIFAPRALVLPPLPSLFHFRPPLRGPPR